MKRILFSFFLLLVILGLVSPYFTGLQAKQEFAKLTENSFYSGLTLKETHYEQGWLTANARTVYQLSDVNVSDDEMRQRIIFNHHIRHAFPPHFTTVIKSTIESIPSELETQSTGTQFQAHWLPATLSTDVHWNGNVVSRYAVPDVALERENEKIRGQALSGEIRLNLQTQHVINQLSIPTLEYGNSHGQIVFKEMDLSANLQDGLLGFMTGDGQLQIKQIELQSDLLPTTRLQAVNIRWNNQIEHDQLTLTIHGHLNQAQTTEGDYGPGLIEFELSQLHLPSLHALQQQIKIANQWSGTQKNFMIMGAMLQHLPNLMATKPQLTVKQFYFDTPKGRSEGQLLVSVVSQPAGAAVLNPQAWLQAINGELDLSLPKAALENLIAVLLELPPQEFKDNPQVQQHMTQLVNKGWFIVDQQTDFYKTAVQLKQGDLTVNGRVLNSSETKI